VKRWHNFRIHRASARSRHDWPLPADEIPPLAAHVVTLRSGYTHHGIHVAREESCTTLGLYGV
jgi:hypothetical protein